LRLIEFDDEQIELFITNWFGKTSPEKTRPMIETIQKNKNIKALARNPLMISIIAIIYEEERHLPQRRVELYKLCIDVLLNRWDLKRKIKNKYDEKAKEKILRKIALEFHILEKRTFTKDEVLINISKTQPSQNYRV
jgi:predicted NACHT family NTPase